MSQILRAGELRQIVTIKKPGPLDGNGNPNPEWITEVSNVPALVEPQTGLRAGPDSFWDPKAGNTQMIPTETHRVTIRYWTTMAGNPLDATRRVIFEGRVLDILSVSDYQSRRIFMRLSCRERVGVTDSDTPGPGGDMFADDIVPIGAIDGVNRVYTLPNAPNPPTSLKLYKNGERLTEGAGDDYMLSGTTITYAVPLSPGDIHTAPDTHICDYRF